MLDADLNIHGPLLVLHTQLKAAEEMIRLT